MRHYESAVCELPTPLNPRGSWNIVSFVPFENRPDLITLELRRAPRALFVAPGPTGIVDFLELRPAGLTSIDSSTAAATRTALFPDDADAGQYIDRIVDVAADQSTGQIAAICDRDGALLLIDRATGATRLVHRIDPAEAGYADTSDGGSGLRLAVGPVAVPSGLGGWVLQ